MDWEAILNYLTAYVLLVINNTKACVHACVKGIKRQIWVAQR
jgi:hypothetical protein